MKYFLKLIRWQNLLMIIYIYLALRYCVLGSFFHYYGLELRFPFVYFVMLVLATVFIAAGGYVINDYFDVETDRLNKKDPVIGYYFSTNLAIFLYIVFSLIGLILGTIVSVKIGHNSFALIFFIAASLLWFYSSAFKRSFLIGNLIVAFLAALIPLMVLIYDLLPAMEYYRPEIRVMEINMNIPALWMIGYAVFAFLYTFVREVVKDLEDSYGDQKRGYKTLALTIGQIPSKILTTLILLINIGLLIWVFVKYLNLTLSLIYLALFLVIPSLITIILIIKAKDKKHYHRISTLLKVIMFLGVSYSFVVCYIFHTYK